MLSKFHSNNKIEGKKISRRMVANLLMKEVERKKEVVSSGGIIKAENSLKNERKKVKWQTNPLYKPKTRIMEESESESVISLSSKQSYLQSERSVDSGYKSNPEERDEFQENIFGKRINSFQMVAEVLDTMNAPGGKIRRNEMIGRTLEACGQKLEKLDLNSHNLFSSFH